MIFRYNPRGHSSSRPGDGRGRRPDSGGTETSKKDRHIPRKGKDLRSAYLALFAVFRLSYSWLWSRRVHHLVMARDRSFLS